MIRIRTLLALLVCTALLAGCTAPAAKNGVTADRHVTASVDGAGKTGIRGKVVLRESGEGLGGAFVNLYPDAISNLLGPSQFISGPSKTDGSFFVATEPGSYFVVARKRQGGGSTGPLAPGDFYSEHQRVLAEVKAGKITEVDLPVIPMKAPMFFKKEVVDTETDTGIRGRLLDTAGNPIPGGFAMAYVDRDMKRLPDYASTLSDENGNFTIYLPEGGTFYLAGRLHAWDMPKPGEPYGIYGTGVAKAITVTAGNFVEQIDIPMAPFDGPYHPGKSKRPF